MVLARPKQNIQVGKCGLDYECAIVSLWGVVYFLIWFNYSLSQIVLHALLYRCCVRGLHFFCLLYIREIKKISSFFDLGFRATSEFFVFSILKSC